MFENDTLEGILDTLLSLVQSIGNMIGEILALEHSELFQTIQPYLLQILDDPLLLAGAFVVCFGLPYAYFKIRKINREAEETFEELEESDLQEFDEDEVEKPLFPQTAFRSAHAKSQPMPARAHEEKDEDENLEDLEMIAMGLEEDEEETGFKSRGEPVQANHKPLEQTQDEIHLEEEDLSPELTELMKNAFELDEESPSVTASLAEDKLSEEDLQDQAIMDLQAEMEESINRLTEHLTQKPEGTPVSEPAPPEPTAEVDEDWKSMMSETFDWENEGMDAPVIEDETLEEESIMDLQKEMEESINKISEEISKPVGITPNFDYSEELEEIEKEAETEELLASLQKPPPRISSASLAEELTLDESLLKFDEPPAPPKPVREPAAPVPQPEPVAREERKGVKPPPPRPPAPKPILEEKEGEPLFSEILEKTVSAKTDQLVSRLKEFQDKLEGRFQSLESGSVGHGTPVPRRDRTYERAEIHYERRRPLVNDREYIRLLESFIFLDSQKKR